MIAQRNSAGHSPDDDPEFSRWLARMSAADGDAGRRAEFRAGFARLRSGLALYPTGASPAAVLDSATRTVRPIAQECLPLAVAIVMHLYPWCALQCAPLPRPGLAALRRSLLVQAIRRRSLILANAGSERVQGAGKPPDVTRSGNSLRISGRFDYVSLASVADLVFFSAPCGRFTAFCVADLHGGSVHVGDSRFGGSMQLADTRPITFDDHPIPAGHFLLADDDDGSRCIFDYQRCWFHLLLADAYLARTAELQRCWRLTHDVEQRMVMNELACLRQFAIHLLEGCRPRAPLDHLVRVSAALKLRVSTLAQATGARLRELRSSRDPDAGTLATQSDELCYMRRQPTADERILRALPS